MKDLLIGATGPTSQEIVKQRLAEGRDITALVCDASTVAVSELRLYLIAGDILNAVEMDAAMIGQAAAICAGGAGSSFAQASRPMTKQLASSVSRSTGTGVTVGKVAHADVAAFVLQQLAGDDWVHPVGCTFRQRSGEPLSCSERTFGLP